MIPRPLLSTLAVLAVGLPIVVVVLLAVSAILGAMGDANGQLAVTWVGRAAGILWIIDLVLLLISLASPTSAPALEQSPPVEQVQRPTHEEAGDQGDRTEHDHSRLTQSTCVTPARKGAGKGEAVAP